MKTNTAHSAKRTAKHKILVTAFLAAAISAAVSGCGSGNDAPAASESFWEPIPAADGAAVPAADEAAAPAADPASETQDADAAIVSTSENAGSSDTDKAASDIPETETSSGRQDGERFEEVIILEGMEEPVRYEHVRSEALGFEMDYDYELLTRRSELDRECFISVYDDPASPEDYLEVTYSTDDAETAAASISDALSDEYELSRETFPLDYAGSCIRISAEELRGRHEMPDHLRTFYIIPAPDGCRIATVHCFITDAEGFGRRFSYMVRTLRILAGPEKVQDTAAPAAAGTSVSAGDGSTGNRVTEELAYEGVSNYCHSEYDWSYAEEDPDSMYIAMGEETESDYQVIFRSYTGAFVYFYVNKADGTTRMTEYVPALDIEEEAGTINLFDYLER